MRRSVLIVAVLLAAGAALNAGVAVALFATGEQIRAHRTTHYDLVSGTQHVRRGTTCTINGVPARDEVLPPWLNPEGDATGWHARITPGRWAGDSVAAGLRCAAGWPLPSIHHSPPSPGIIPPRAPGGPPIRWFAMTGGSIPRQVHWAGFLANTVIYACALALPLAFFPARSALRSRRGRCPRCGYDVRGLQTCPECGAPRRRTAPLPMEGDAR